MTEFILYIALSCFGFILLAKYIPKFLLIRQELLDGIRKQKLKDCPLLYIEEVAQNGTIVYVAYNAAEKCFVCQGNTLDEVTNGIRRVFFDKKSVSLIKDYHTLVPLNIN